jgi:hypothetical protein
MGGIDVQLPQPRTSAQKAPEILARVADMGLVHYQVLADPKQPVSGQASGPQPGRLDQLVAALACLTQARARA